MQQIGDARPKYFHIRGRKAACRHGRDAQSQPGPFRRASRVERDRVLVGCDAGLGQHSFSLLAEKAHRCEIEQHHVGVGAAADYPDAAVSKRGGEHARVLHDSLPIDFELRAKGLAQAYCLGGENVGVKASLDTGEDRGLKAFCEFV